MSNEIEGDKYNIYQTLDLEEIFGVDKTYDDVIKGQVGQMAIDMIVERTKNNKGINGRSLKSYSDDYIDSASFEKWGKSASDVNMELTGDMMLDLDIIEQTDTTVTIGFKNETNQMKAANHNFGVTLPERPFFGVNKQEIDRIKNEFIDQIEQKRTVGEYLDMAISQKVPNKQFKTLLGDLVDEGED